MINSLVNRIRIIKLKRNGLEIGKNVNIEKGVIIDPSAPWLISIGNNVTIAPYVHILAHDASTKLFTNYTKLGKVIIGNNVFIGTKTVILPNIEIGNNVIIGAGSIVTKSIPSDSVVIGNPAKIICKTDEFINKHRIKMNNQNQYDRKERNGKKYIPSKDKNNLKKIIKERNDWFYIN